jgi:hypothetical protein
MQGPSNEEILQALRNYSAIETERFKIMATQQGDILAKVTAISASIEEMKTRFDTAMTDMVATVPAGHTAVLDTFVAPLDDLAMKIVALGAEFEAKVTEAKTKITPVPGAAPVA